MLCPIWETQVFNQGLKVTLINNVFSCNLPYSGNSRVATYGSQDLYITAEELPVEVKSEFIEKKKRYNIKFQFTSKHDNEIFNVSMNVYLNGKVEMTVSSSKRSSIRYLGGLYVNY